MLGASFVPAVPVERPLELRLRQGQVTSREPVRRPCQHVGQVAFSQPADGVQATGSTR